MNRGPEQVILVPPSKPREKSLSESGTYQQALFFGITGPATPENRARKGGKEAAS
jgi:hypothetical protein